MSLLWAGFLSWVKDDLCPGRAPEGQVVYSKRSLTLVQSDAFKSAFLQRHSAECSRGCYHVSHTQNRHGSGLGNTRCNRFLFCRFFFLYLMFSVVPTVESLCRILSYAHLSGDLCPIKDARCLPWSLCSGQHPGTLLSSERLHHGPPASPITSP